MHVCYVKPQVRDRRINACLYYLPCRCGNTRCPSPSIVSVLNGAEDDFPMCIIPLAVECFAFWCTAAPPLSFIRMEFLGGFPPPTSMGSMLLSIEGASGPTTPLRPSIIDATPGIFLLEDTWGTKHWHFPKHMHAFRNSLIITCNIPHVLECPYWISELQWDWSDTFKGQMASSESLEQLAAWKEDRIMSETNPLMDKPGGEYGTKALLTTSNGADAGDVGSIIACFIGSCVLLCLEIRRGTIEYPVSLSASVLTGYAQRQLNARSPALPKL